MSQVLSKGDRWPDQLERWNRIHGRKLRSGDFRSAPNPLAPNNLTRLFSSGAKTLLELGCGLGNDALYFAESGFETTASDFSEIALQVAKERALRASLTNIQFLLMDLASPFGIKDDAFDAVYAHLSLHYFTHRTTVCIFDEIHRALRKHGILIMSVKSVRDPLFGKGIGLAERIFNNRGHVRHFFTASYLRDNLSRFEMVELSQHEGFYDGHRSSFLWGVAIKV